jgi:Protein of unknown function (DUF1552)
MKLSIHQRFRRRDLLKSIGGAAFALPALELFERDARAQATTKTSKYVVFCYTPDGVNQQAFWPTGTTSNFTLSPILSPFQPYQDKMLILGPQMSGTSPTSNTGLKYISGTPQHQAPVTLAARTGHSCSGNNCSGTLGFSYLTQATAVNKLDGPSIDQVIAKVVKGDSTFGSLNFGLHPVGGDTPSDINFQEDGTSLKRLAGADEAWTQVFGVTTGTNVPVTGVSPAHKLTAVTDFLHARFTALRPVLSAADRVTLDGHLAALRTYEDRANKRLGTSGPTTTTDCSNPVRASVLTDANSIRTGADTETLSPFFMDIIATSFSCNLTKVASVTFGYPGGGDAGGLRMPWLGFTDPLHFVSHHANNPTLLDKYQKMSTWIAGQIAGLMQRLAARPSSTGTGTLLDETTIYWFNRHGDGNAHTNYALPNVILGGTGGYFKMGRWLQLAATNPTKVLISIANAMGVNVPSFGEPSFVDTAPLAILTG